MSAETQLSASSADLTSLFGSEVVASGFCDLRAEGSTSRGSIGAVFCCCDADDHQYFVCGSCVAAHGWLAPGRDA
jgi:hypothetical protein